MFRCLLYHVCTVYCLFFISFLFLFPLVSRPLFFFYHIIIVIIIFFVYISSISNSDLTISARETSHTYTRQKKTRPNYKLNTISGAGEAQGSLPLSYHVLFVIMSEFPLSFVRSHQEAVYGTLHYSDFCYFLSLPQ